MRNKTTAVSAGLLTVLFAIVPFRLVLADTLWTVYNQTNSQLPSDYVTSIGFDSEGDQYICTAGRGLAIRRNNQWNIWNESNSGVSINSVRLSRRDPHGNLFAAAASGNLDMGSFGFGVARLDGVDSTWLMMTQGLEVNQTVTGIVLDIPRRFVSTYGGGITIYDDAGWIRYRFSSRTVYTYADDQQQVFNVPNGTYIPSDFIKAIDYDYGSSTLWLATANGGAVRYDGSQWTTFNSGNSGLPSNQLLSVRINPANGKVVFGTAGFGAAEYDNSGWAVYNPSNSPMTNGIISTLEYRPDNGDLWIGTGYGVWVRKNDGQWQGYIPPDNDFIWGNFYSDISFDSTGLVWVSAYGGGMASLPIELEEPPPPPPDDGLDIDVQRMFIYFYNHRPVERIFTEFDLENVPDLEEIDSIFFQLDSDLGVLYSFKVPFGDFRHRGWHLGNDDVDDDPYDDSDGILYRYIDGSLKIFLLFDEYNPSSVHVSIKDRDAHMNRENYHDNLTLTMAMGEIVGACDIMLTGGNQWDVPEFNDDGEDNQAQVFALVIPTSQITDDAIPRGMKVNLENYPNPFNGSTNIAFNLPVSGSVDVTVYDMLGRIVEKLYSGNLSSGRHAFSWPEGGSVKTGIYLCRITIDGQSISRKMMYLK